LIMAANAPPFDASWGALLKDHEDIEKLRIPRGLETEIRQKLRRLWRDHLDDRRQSRRGVQKGQAHPKRNTAPWSQTVIDRPVKQAKARANRKATLHIRARKKRKYKHNAKKGVTRPGARRQIGVSRFSYKK